MHSDARYPKFELFRVDALLVAMMPHFRQTDRTESHDLPKRSRSQGVLSSTCDKGPCNENGADSPGGHVTLVRSEPLRRRRETTERRRSQSRSASAHIAESRNTTGRDWPRGPDNELVCSIFQTGWDGLGCFPAVVRWSQTDAATHSGTAGARRARVAKS